MKKVLLAIAAVATITSCSQNEEFENPAQSNEINFTSVVGKATRATVAVTETLQDNGYKLYAYNTGDKNIADATSLGEAFINDEGKYENSTWKLKTGGYYWPLNEKIHFSHILQLLLILDLIVGMLQGSILVFLILFKQRQHKKIC